MPNVDGGGGGGRRRCRPVCCRYPVSRSRPLATARRVAGTGGRGRHPPRLPNTGTYQAQRQWQHGRSTRRYGHRHGGEGALLARRVATGPARRAAAKPVPRWEWRSAAAPAHHRQRADAPGKTPSLYPPRDRSRPLSKRGRLPFFPPPCWVHPLPTASRNAPPPPVRRRPQPWPPSQPPRQASIARAGCCRPCRYQ